MVDPQLRNINIQINEVCYSITFRPALFGRVKDVQVFSGLPNHHIYALDKSVKIEPQNVSAVQALKRICGSITEDITMFLRRLFRLRL